MVKKLFKHEFIAYWRVMSIVYLVLFTVAGAGRVIQFFETDSTPYKIVFTFSCITYGISILAALGFTFVLGIVRFYKNLFTGEGYLTLTLPVTPSQHIWVKVATAVCMELVTLVAVLLSGCIITAGDMLVEIWKAVAYLLGQLWGEIGAQSIAIGSEIAVLFLLGSFSSYLLYYTFIAIGQLFKKHRILAAVGAYFVYYIASQVVSTVLTVILSFVTISGEFEEFLIWLADLAQNQPYTLIHCSLGIIALFVLAGCLIEFWIVRRIITKKLNLE